MAARRGLYLHKRSSFASIFRAQDFTWSPSQNFLASPTFNVVNPRNHIAKGDTVTTRLPLSAVSGLKDEAILALLTKGYFGGWVFAIEGWSMAAFNGILPASYEAFKDKPTKKIIFKASDIPRDRLVPIGDMFFDFALLDKHIKSPIDQAPSHVDYGFGSDKRPFSGSHRFAIVRGSGNHAKDGEKDLDSEEGYIELYVECFRCNPIVNRDSWAESLPWLHYWYARLLWAEAVKTLLRR